MITDFHLLFLLDFFRSFRSVEPVECRFAEDVLLLDLLDELDELLVELFADRFFSFKWLFKCIAPRLNDEDDLPSIMLLLAMAVEFVNTSSMLWLALLLPLVMLLSALELPLSLASFCFGAALPVENCSAARSMLEPRLFSELRKRFLLFR